MPNITTIHAITYTNTIHLGHAFEAVQNTQSTCLIKSKSPRVSPASVLNLKKG